MRRYNPFSRFLLWLNLEFDYVDILLKLENHLQLMIRFMKVMMMRYGHREASAQDNGSSFEGLVTRVELSESVFREIFELNQSKSYYFQVQPVTVVIFFFLNQFEVCTIGSSKMIGKSPEVLSLSWLFLKLNQFVCNQQSLLPFIALSVLGSKFRQPN